MARFQLLVLVICGMGTTILGCEAPPRERARARETREVETPAGVPITVVARGDFGGVWLAVIRDEERGVTCYISARDSIFCVPDAVRPTAAVDAGGR